jgi:hypothetical protein
MAWLPSSAALWTSPKAGAASLSSRPGHPAGQGVDLRTQNALIDEIRISAARPPGLWPTSEPSAVDALIKSADNAEGWGATEATKSCLLLANRLAATGQKSQAAWVYTHLRDTGGLDRAPHSRNRGKIVDRHYTLMAAQAAAPRT